VSACKKKKETKDNDDLFLKKKTKKNKKNKTPRLWLEEKQQQKKPDDESIPRRNSVEKMTGRERTRLATVPSHHMFFHGCFVACTQLAAESAHKHHLSRRVAESYSYRSPSLSLSFRSLFSPSVVVSVA
jgi:hypothetical protein